MSVRMVGCVLAVTRVPGPGLPGYGLAGEAGERRPVPTLKYHSTRTVRWASGFNADHLIRRHLQCLAFGFFADVHFIFLFRLSLIAATPSIDRSNLIHATDLITSASDSLQPVEDKRNSDAGIPIDFAPLITFASVTGTRIVVVGSPFFRPHFFRFPPHPFFAMPEECLCR